MLPTWPPLLVTAPLKPSSLTDRASSDVLCATTRGPLSPLWVPNVMRDQTPTCPLEVRGLHANSLAEDKLELSNNIFN